MSEKEVDLRHNSNRLWQKTVCERVAKLIKATQSLFKETKISTQFTHGELSELFTITKQHKDAASTHTIPSIHN